MLREISADEDAPYFTPQGVFQFFEPRRFWVAVYTLRGDEDEKHPPGLVVLSKDEEMPMVFHGGCTVVNLIADPDDGQTLASWCNIDDRPTADGSPRRLSTLVRR